MKKRLCVILAVLMVLCMSTTVFASSPSAGSSSGSGSTATATPAATTPAATTPAAGTTAATVSADGTTATLTSSTGETTTVALATTAQQNDYANASTTYVATTSNVVVAVTETTNAYAVDTTADNATVGAIAESTFDVTNKEVATAVETLATAGQVTGGKVVAARVVFVADVTGTANSAFTLRVADVKATDKVVAIHQKADGTKEYIPAVAGNGTVTLTLTSFSPVAIVKVSDVAVTSPQTGANTMLLVLAAIAVVGAALTVKKIRMI